MSDGRVKLNEIEKATRLGVLRVELTHGVMTTPASFGRVAFKAVDFVSEKALKGRAITHGIE